MRENRAREFRLILAELLNTLNLNQTEFAKSIDVKQSQISEWLKGKAKPGYDSLRRIAIVHSIDCDYLLGISD